MKIASYKIIDDYLIRERPVRLCEICDRKLADAPFVYWFDDGEALYADLCTECWLPYESRDELAVLLIGFLIERNQVRIEAIEWILRY